MAAVTDSGLEKLAMAFVVFVVLGNRSKKEGPPKSCTAFFSLRKTVEQRERCLTAESQDHHTK
jgi:hypothetical protein